MDQGILHFAIPLADPIKYFLYGVEQQLRFHVLIDNDHSLQALIRFLPIGNAIPDTEIKTIRHSGGSTQCIGKSADVQQILPHHTVIPWQQCAAAEYFFRRVINVYLQRQGTKLIENDI